MNHIIEHTRQILARQVCPVHGEGAVVRVANGRLQILKQCCPQFEDRLLELADHALASEGDDHISHPEKPKAKKP